MIDTILIIVEQTLLHIPLLLGAYISFSLLKVPDLSIESAYVVGALFGSHVLMGMHGMPSGLIVFAVIGASLLGGALVGLTSSIMTQKAHLPHLLSCIITFGIFHGIVQLISATYVSLSQQLNPLDMIVSFAQHPELPMLMIIGCAVILVCYLLCKTQLGYACAVYGNNPRFFSNYGINTSYVFIIGVAISNALAGLSGYLFVQSNNFFELNIGVGKALQCITALILGKALMRSTKPLSVFIPIIGTIAYFTLQQLLLKTGFNLKYFSAVQAIIVLLILIYTYRTNPNKSIDNVGV